VSKGELRNIFLRRESNGWHVDAEYPTRTINYGPFKTKERGMRMREAVIESDLQRNPGRRPEPGERVLVDPNDPDSEKVGIGDLVRVIATGDIGTVSRLPSIGDRTSTFTIVSIDGREISPGWGEIELVHDNPNSVMIGPGSTTRDKLRGATKRNPATPEVRATAIEKYKEFHRYEPTKLTEFPKGFLIPRKMVRAGAAKWTTYRSGKVDPSTLKTPKRAISYIHEHGIGVSVYFEPDAPELDELDVDERQVVELPDKFTETQALVKLGDNLGFCIKGENGDEDAEFESSGKLPELYCTPDGRCLFVVQDRKEVIAAIYGGGLGVFSRGIDG
jgi:hypothetical protein